jgi:hypothetical protein
MPIRPGSAKVTVPLRWRLCGRMVRPRCSATTPRSRFDRSRTWGVDANELGRIIDHTYTPPGSVGVHPVSVLNDNLQHAGQARYLRGIIDELR